MIPQTTYHSQKVGEVDVFYRAAGPADAPAIMLLHGYPTSSHMFRNLIPHLAENFRVIAPDLPGFGSTVVPEGFHYTFDQLAATIDAFTEAIGLKRFAVYVFDYGSPVGFRLATAHPERITAIITQNGNAYEEGLADGWAAIRAYWNDESKENRDALRDILKPEATRVMQYTHGVPEHLLNLIGPDPLAHDQAIIDRDPELQLDLFLDYRSNVALYPTWQAYLREEQPPVLAIWGKNDVFFLPAGAEAFRRDVPDAQIEFLDTGHFALETHAREIGARVTRFLSSMVR